MHIFIHQSRAFETTRHNSFSFSPSPRHANPATGFLLSSATQLQTFGTENTTLMAFTSKLKTKLRGLEPRITQAGSASPVTLYRAGHDVVCFTNPVPPCSTHVGRVNFTLLSF